MKNLLSSIAILMMIFIILSCQDEELNELEQVDQDMIEAIQNADNYLAEEQGRTSSVTDVDVTVLKYSDSLIYKTNTITGEYEAIMEETITAHSKPGGYIFWFPGGGVQELIEIDLEEASEKHLGHDAFEVLPGELWALYIPLDYDTSMETLKYDIVYRSTTNEIIRLDPKIQIKSYR